MNILGLISQLIGIKTLRLTVILSALKKKKVYIGIEPTPSPSQKGETF